MGLAPGEHYRQGRGRIAELVGDLSDDEWDRPVPTCPGWRVRDVIAHLATTAEDALGGHLTGIPDDETTGDQVQRRLGDDPRELMAAWERDAPAFEELITAFKIWPAAIDVVTHEHDIRGALERPGARDHESVSSLARLTLRVLDLPVPVAFDLGDQTVVVGEAPPKLTLTISPFELLRVRLGRRSRDQIAALDWSGDPSEVLAGLCTFGPAERPILE